jgi:hypothetical protein
MKQFQNLITGMDAKNHLKKAILMIVAIGLLCFSKTGYAQIELEHTFDGYVTTNNTNISPPVIDYYLEYYPTTSNQVKIYNKADYSLYKSVVVAPPSNYSIQHFYFPDFDGNFPTQIFPVLIISGLVAYFSVIVL